MSALALLVALGWVGMVVLVAHRLRPAPVRLRALVGRAGERRRDRSPIELLAVAAVIAADIALGPGPGALIGATVVAAVWSQARRRTEIEHDELVAELPELVELLALAIDSGLTIRLAVEEVARHAEGRLGAALREICVDQWSGRAVAAGLEQLGLSLGEPLRPLVAAMLDAERYGAPLGPTLARLGDDARIARRRRAEERSRRLPVRLLFPLVGCVLPAFVALTIAPVALATLARLRGA